ncbi:MAG: hypothetical protein Kow0031_13720 [Anaerolineae bacterium]
MPVKPSPPHPIRVDLHGLTLTFHSDDPTLAARFETVYGHLPRPQVTANGINIHWQPLDAPAAPPPPPELPLLLEESLIGYYGDANRLAIRLPKYALLEVDFAAGRVSGQVTPACLSVYGVFEDVMMISLAPLYRRRGWFPLHAFAAQAPNGRAALITGGMGAGKTTTGLALLCAGWKLLSNDSPLLRQGESGVTVLAYPGQLSAFDDSLARFEPLRRFVPGDAAAGAPRREKRVFSAEEAFAQPWAGSAPAGGVFFPQVTPGLARSELEPLPPAEAVVQLLPQAIEGWDRAAIGRHLSLLTRLAESAPCYRLRLSPRVEQLPGLILQGMQAGPA